MIEESRLKCFTESHIRDILKNLDRYALGKQASDIKELKKKLFPSEQQITQRIKITKDNLKTIYQELVEGKHSENKNDYCREILKLVNKTDLKSNKKKEIEDFCRKNQKNKESNL